MKIRSHSTTIENLHTDVLCIVFAFVASFDLNTLLLVVPAVCRKWKRTCAYGQIEAHNAQIFINAQMFMQRIIKGKHCEMAGGMKRLVERIGCLKKTLQVSMAITGSLTEQYELTAGTLTLIALISPVTHLVIDNACLQPKGIEDERDVYLLPKKLTSSFTHLKFVDCKFKGRCLHDLSWRVRTLRSLTVDAPSGLSSRSGVRTSGFMMLLKRSPELRFLSAPTYPITPYSMLQVLQSCAHLHVVKVLGVCRFYCTDCDISWWWDQLTLGNTHHTNLTRDHVTIGQFFSNIKVAYSTVHFEW
jgi:hypothetical protein